jgi:hypothetical protein
MAGDKAKNVRITRRMIAMGRLRVAVSAVTAFRKMSYFRLRVIALA